MKKIFQNFSEFQRGVFLVLLSLVFMVIAYVVTRYAVNIYHPSVYDIAFWGSFGAVILSLPFIIFSTKKKKSIVETCKKYPRTIFFTIISSTLASGVWFFLITLVSSDILSLFDQTAIVWSIFLAIIFLGEKVRFLQFIALFLAATGVYIISQAEISLSPVVLVLLIFGPFLYGLQSLILKKYGKGVDSFSLAWIRTVGMMLSFLIVFGAMGKISFPPLGFFLLVAFAQASGMIVNRMFFIESHEYLSMSKLNFFYILVPVIIFFISPFIEQDFGFYPEKYLGAGLVILGLLLFLWKKKG